MMNVPPYSPANRGNRQRLPAPMAIPKEAKIIPHRLLKDSFDIQQMRISNITQKLPVEATNYSSFKVLAGSSKAELMVLWLMVKRASNADMARAMAKKAGFKSIRNLKSVNHASRM